MCCWPESTLYDIEIGGKASSGPTSTTHSSDGSLFVKISFWTGSDCSPVTENLELGQARCVATGSLSSTTDSLSTKSESWTGSSLLPKSQSLLPRSGFKERIMSFREGERRHIIL
ncbi:hypothetical protein J6590_019367, partial [Homalodisca vitripennis]